MRRFLRFCGLGIVVFWLPSLPAEALTLGKLSLIGLANVSQYSVTPPSGSKVISTAHLGFGAGLLTEIELSPNAIGVELGGLYVQRKYGDSTVTLTETRIEVPVMLRLWIGGIGIGAGVYGAYGLGEIADDGGSAESYEARELSALDFGWVGSAALTIGLGQRSTSNLLIDGRLSSSLGNASTQDGATGSYVNYQLLTGIQFGL